MIKQFVKNNHLYLKFQSPTSLLNGNSCVQAGNSASLPAIEKDKEAK